MTASALHRSLALTSDRLDACDLAAAPRWEPARTAAIPGQCRGVLLADWAENFEGRWGAAAVAFAVHFGVTVYAWLTPTRTGAAWDHA